MGYNPNWKERIMKILNFGSLNIDYVYSIDHLVEPGETILSKDLKIFCGGKGLNQSIAIARAGDTFTGYFIECIRENLSVEKALEKASIAASLSVARHGASESIPARSEVDQSKLDRGRI
jgi:sugar/nucleoside kinase (ribokinase family)